MEEQVKNTPNFQADLSQLVNVGKLEEEIEIAGFTFKIRTLTSKENTECLAALQTMPDLSKITELRDLVLARAIVAVQGKPLEALYIGPEKTKDQAGNERTLTIKEKKLNVVGNWQSGLTSKLWSKYEALKDRSEDFFKEENEEETENSLGN